jgi:hypothetical protein
LQLCITSTLDIKHAASTRPGLTLATAGQVEAREQEEGEGEWDAHMDSVCRAILRITDSRVSLSK